MVRNYKSKTNRADIDEQCIKNAVRAVLCKQMSERVALEILTLNVEHCILE
jgi:hypothetical protein